MDRKLLLLQALLLQQAAGSPTQADIRRGIVPIFSNRATNEPVTFTFTTPTSNKRVPVTEFPVKVDTANKFPTLRPEPYEGQSSVWESLVDIPKIDISMPIINQAQYFRALQSAGLGNLGSKELPPGPQKIISIPDSPIPSSPKVVNVPSPLTQNLQSDTLWRGLESAWDNAKVRLSDADALTDWRRLWEKLTGVLEPFLMEVGERFGKAVNRAMKQQAGVTWKAEGAKQN